MDLGAFISFNGILGDFVYVNGKTDKDFRLDVLLSITKTHTARSPPLRHTMSEGSC